MTYRVRHATEYTYAEPVSVSHHALHLKPRRHPRQTARNYRLSLLPAPTVLSDRLDYFGNPETFCTVQDPHKTLAIEAVSEIEVSPANWPEPVATPAWETASDELEATQFTFDSPFIRVRARYAEYARVSFTPGRPLLDAVLDLTGRIHAEFSYDPRATNVATPLEEVIEKRRGVCQDFAHFEIACLRALGVPARYVSGYIQTTRAPGKERLVGADASHAWVSVFCPGHGWIDVDPTNNLLSNCQHLTVAWGRDYGDVPPVRGIIVGGGAHQLRVAVEVLPQ